MSDDRRAASRYHVRTANEVIAELGSDADAGLSAHEVLLRHELFGPNVLRASTERRRGGCSWGSTTTS